MYLNGKKWSQTVNEDVVSTQVQKPANDFMLCFDPPVLCKLGLVFNLCERFAFLSAYDGKVFSCKFTIHQKIKKQPFSPTTKCSNCKVRDHPDDTTGKYASSPTSCCLSPFSGVSIPCISSDLPLWVLLRRTSFLSYVYIIGFCISN